MSFLLRNGAYFVYEMESISYTKWRFPYRKETCVLDVLGRYWSVLDVLDVLGRYWSVLRDVPNSRFIGKNCRMGIFGVGIGTLRQHFVQCRLSISGDSTSFYPISGVTIQINVREENFLSLKTRIARRRRKIFYDQHSSRLLGISLEYF